MNVAAKPQTGTAVNIVVDQNPKSTALPGGAVTLVVSAGGA